MFGFPALPSYDMPGGGPAYPLSSLGARLRFKPNSALTVLGGVFDGNPAPGIGDPQQLDHTGTTFNLHNGAMVMGELQYAINQAPATGSAVQPSGLPGTYKLGFWYDTQRFPAPQYGTGFRSEPSVPRRLQRLCHRGPDGVAPKRRQSAIAWRLRRGDGRAEQS
jgi:porin